MISPSISLPNRPVDLQKHPSSHSQLGKQLGPSTNSDQMKSMLLFHLLPQVLECGIVRGSLTENRDAEARLPLSIYLF